jgi:hypothetical protein
MCGSGTPQRLSCVSIPVLCSGSNPDIASIAATDTGWLVLVGSSGDARMQLIRVSPQLVATPLAVINTVGGVYSAALGAEGSRWVMGWSDVSNPDVTSFWCLTDGNFTAQSVSVPGGLDSTVQGNLSLAIDGLGDVAGIATQFSSDLHYGIGLGGCPAQLGFSSGGGLSGTGGVALHVAGADASGFRFTATSQMGADGRLQLILPSDAGQLLYTPGEAIPAHSSALSTDGALATIIYQDLHADGGSTLMGAMIPTDAGADFDGLTAITNDFITWQVTATDAGEFALTWESRLTHDVHAQRFSATRNSITPGTMLDVACNLPSAVLSVAYFQGRLGFVLTNGSGIDFYSCELP